MAEYLIKNNIVTTYEPGDVVMVKPDGWQWGTEEHPLTAINPHFWIAKVPGQSFEDALIFAQSLTDIDEIIIKKRRFNISWSLIPQQIKNQINKNGEYTLDITTFNSFIVDKLV